MTCPMCGSDDVGTTTERFTTRNDYSPRLGVSGYLMSGKKKRGLLLGFLGDEKVSYEEVCCCGECGAKWKMLEH